MFLTPAELSELVGSPRHDKQIAWLRANAWLFSVDRHGRLKVARAYFDRRMVGIASTEPTAQNADPDWAAAGM